MKIQCIPIVSLIWLTIQIGVHAIEPTNVDGNVSIEVDRTERVWAITVTNASTEKLRYEMIGQVPRGLGLEVWDGENRDFGWRVHAENLAHMNMDGFPADIREIAPGESAQFQLNPDSMSATSDLALATWERERRSGFYDCRVFFGAYASRMVNVTPRERAIDAEDDEAHHDATAWLDGAEDEAGEGENDTIIGSRIRRMLNDENLALVNWSRRSDREGEYHITYTTCHKDDLEQLAPMHENTPMKITLPTLIAKARTIASDQIEDCVFEGLMINPCENDDSKHYASIYFSDDRDEVVIHLLLNGATTRTSKLSLTQEQYRQLGDFGIPEVREEE